jgi:DNA-binding NtrC family response regulator
MLEDPAGTEGYLRVLIVDDDVELTDSLADALQLNDIIVAVANSGEEALDLIKIQSFDCVLMDIMMPGMNGIETMRRAMEFSPGITVILMTAYSIEELIDEAKGQGAVTVLKKPLQVDALVAFFNQLKARSSVLFVDDDPTTYQVLHDTLAPRGYRVFAAKDTGEAVAAFSLDFPGIVFMNQETKNRTGKETAIAIRELDARAVFALLNTYADTDQLAAESVQPGSLIALTKPFKVDAVVALFEQLRAYKLQRMLEGPRVEGT